MPQREGTERGHEDFSDPAVVQGTTAGSKGPKVWWGHQTGRKVQSGT